METDLTQFYCLLPIIFLLVVLVAYLWGRVQGPRFPTVWLGRWRGPDGD